MSKNLIVCVFLSLVLCVVMSGCLGPSVGMSDEEKIMGLWERVNFDLKQTWRFKDDGTIVISGTNLDVSYFFENDTLVVYYPVIQYADRFNYSFDGTDVLTLSYIEGAGAVDPNTGKPVDPQNISMVTELVFHRV